MLRSIHYGPLVFNIYILNRRGRHITYVAPLKMIKEWLSDVYQCFWVADDHSWFRILKRVPRLSRRNTLRTHYLIELQPTD